MADSSIVKSAQAFLEANKGREGATTTCTYIAGLLDEIERLREALSELCDIVQGAVDAGAAPGLIDSFTLQPAREALGGHQQSTAEAGK